MRFTAIVLLSLVVLPGCGSNSKDGETQSGGIPLSITGSTPGAQQPENSKLPTVEQYAQAVKQLLQKANAAVVAGRNPVAIESLSQAIGVTPDDASLFRMRADVYSMQGEYANARADFSTAVRLAPDNADLYNFRGYFLLSQNLTAEAKADFDKAVQLNPKHSAALNNRGLLSLATPDFKAAEADFTRAIEADRKSSDAWNNRGFARMKMDQLDSALTDIQQAIRLKDNYVNAWNNCGLIQMQQQKYEDARTSFSRAVELDPMDARWLNHRRAALIKLNQFAEAQKDAQKIEWLAGLTELTQQAGRDARNPNSWITRARHLMRGSQYGAAVQDFTRALVVSPGNPVALAGRAVAWVETGDFQKAMLDCDESLVARPSQEAYSLRGDLWLRLDNLDQAIADFESSGRFDEQVAVAYEKRSAKHREAGAAQESAADTARAREIREAMTDKPSSDKPPASTAEGFDPSGRE